MRDPTLMPAIERALRELRYGYVQLVVHDGQIVRIERMERMRLPAEPSAGAQAQAGLTESLGSP